MDSVNTIARARDLDKSPSEKLLALCVELYPDHHRIPTVIPLMCTLLWAYSFFVRRRGGCGGGGGGNGAALVLIPPHRFLAIPAFLLAKLHSFKELIVSFWFLGFGSWNGALNRELGSHGTDGILY
jgi:hypothetical protein